MKKWYAVLVFHFLMEVLDESKCFDEFLEATDEDLYAYYDKIEKDQPIETLFHNRLLDAYHYYLIIGGMPEC